MEIESTLGSLEGGSDKESEIIERILIIIINELLSECGRLFAILPF